MPIDASAENITDGVDESPSSSAGGGVLRLARDERWKRRARVRRREGGARRLSSRAAVDRYSSGAHTRHSMNVRPWIPFLRAIAAMSLAVAGCRSTGTPETDADPGHRDVALDTGETPDVAPTIDDRPAADVSDATQPRPCNAVDPVDAPTESGECSAVMLTPGPDLCPTGAACPVTAVCRLVCTQQAYGPWVSPFGTDGASVYVVTVGAGAFRSRLFSVTPGARPVAQDLGGLSSAANVMRADRLGRRHIIAGEMPGLWELQEGVSGWTRRAAASSGADLLFATDARFIDDATGFAVGFRSSDQATLIASRAGGCWTSAAIADGMLTFPGMDVDASGHMWSAWTSVRSPSWLIRLRDPGGTLHTVATMPGAAGWFNERPQVLTGGMNGTASWPIVAAIRDEGIHVYVPDAAGTTWTDRVVPASAAGAWTDDCPSLSPSPSVGGCGSRSTCRRTFSGAVSQWGIARAANARIFAAYVVDDISIDLALRTRCTGGLCFCDPSETARRGTVEVVVTRVDETAFTEVTRVRFDSGGPSRMGPPGGFEMSVRGNHLLAAVLVSGAAGTDLRYFEVDVGGP